MAMSFSLLPPEGYDPDEGMRGKLRMALIALAVLVFVIGTAAACVPIGGAVVGSGQVGVESRVKRIAHPAGGIIAEILVENGDHVKKGDPLLRLDDTVSGADAQFSTRSVDQLLAQKGRLEAERLGSSTILWPAEMMARTDESARKAMADESKLFAIRRAESNGIAAQLDARIVQYRKQIEGYRAQIAAIRKQQVLLAPERRGVRELWDQDLVTINRLNQLERTHVDLDGNAASLASNIAQTEARITEAREQLIQTAETRRSEAGTQLGEVNAALNQQTVRSVSAGDLQGRAVITAPYSGTVDKLAFSAVGDVIRPAETILEIVPDKDRLIVEAAVSPIDIDQVRKGQSARVRFSAFNMATTPEFPGTVIVVSAEATANPDTQMRYYTVRIELDAAGIAQSRSLDLKPGMPTEVYIETGSRSMLSYLTKPIRDQLARAFRDN